MLLFRTLLSYSWFRIIGRPALGCHTRVIMALKPPKTLLKTEHEVPVLPSGGEDPSVALVGHLQGDPRLTSAHLSPDGHLGLCPLTDHILMSSAQPEL